MSVIQYGDKFTLANITETYDKLPVGTYMLKFNPDDGFHLIKKEPFELPKKIYGDHSITDRWLKSWKHNTTKNLGILLVGVKGSGKTITAQKFCVDSNLPVILINEEYTESAFLDFITSPKLGKCIVFIDEFEKIYHDRDNQQTILSLMDGNFQTSLVFLLTMNTYNISDYLVNRLNRVKYLKTYDNLELNIVQEVIDDLLVNKTHTASIYEFFEKVGTITFDILINLIKEMNLFKEDANECGKHLNLRGESKSYKIYEVIEEEEYEHYRVELSYIDSEINIERMTYANKKQKGTVTLKFADCTIEKPTSDTMIITHPKEGVFKFIEVKKMFENYLF